MIFILTGTTRGDALIPQKTNVLGASLDRSKIETAMAKHVAERDAIVAELAKEQWPPWTTTNVYDEYGIVEVPEL